MARSLLNYPTAVVVGYEHPEGGRDEGRRSRGRSRMGHWGHFPSSADTGLPIAGCSE